MESLTRSFSTTTVDINKAWRRKVYDGKFEGSPDHRKDIKTARFGDGGHRGRFWKIKKLFNFDRAAPEKQDQSKKSKSKSKTSGSGDDFEIRLMSEIYKNFSASHELS